jgi:hypothetical protein
MSVANGMIMMMIACYMTPNARHDAQLDTAAVSAAPGVLEGRGASAAAAEVFALAGATVAVRPPFAGTDAAAASGGAAALIEAMAIGAVESTAA